MDSSALLSVWELGADQSPIRRGLSLLATAWPERSVEDWAQQPIGERDEHLLRLRESLFGTRLEGVASCPQCAERIELAFATGDIRVPAIDAQADEPTIGIEADGFSLVCRVPNSLDVLESTRMPADEQRGALLQRCVVSAVRGGASVAPATLPESVVSSMAARLAEADPQAAVDIALTCPGCRHQWLMAFDILSYLWGEIEDWARRLVLDIHALASAYGWSERDILAMTPQRRQLYLELLGA